MSNRFNKKDFNNYNGKPFQLYENNNVKNNKSNNMTGNFTKSNLTELYYSQSNIDLLQELIIKGIYNNPKTFRQKISKQSENELLIIMRSIFLQHCKNHPNNIQNQIHELNKLVLDYCIPNIISSIKQYNCYINDITKENTVIDKPQFVSCKGEKTLMPRHFI